MTKLTIRLHGPHFSWPTLARKGATLLAKGEKKNCLEQAEDYLTKLYGSPVLLTTTCTHALEIASRLLALKPGDEVIVPSFTYISTAQAFFQMGAQLVFADVNPLSGNLDPKDVQKKITSRTKAIVIVHYGGASADMDLFVKICAGHKIILIEDAAHALGAKWNNKLLGTFGALATLSFDRSKNITSDKGGALVVNDKMFLDRAYVIRANGSNRRTFLQGIIDEYIWVDSGSQYRMSEITASLVLAQLPLISQINSRRKEITKAYEAGLRLPSSVYALKVDEHSQSSFHIFALVFPSVIMRGAFITYLRRAGIEVAFHYRALHLSPFSKKHVKSSGRLPGTMQMSEGLVRLPLHTHLTKADIKRVIATVNGFFELQSKFSWPGSQHRSRVL